ncbi:DUF4097 family beta strand repeat-containing protein [Actinotalea subterranea]|uniref:DUF4097 family beta strand repeat-containing protein n=1 Tax=Actinotalea subterranea TaxID=2607497 RepID=UPI0011EDE4BA|nr:DUF4097 family beta strand repeat-containing protein [Actinotalea subterranea]
MTTYETPQPVALTVDVAVRADVRIVATSGSTSEVTVVPRNPARALDVRAAEETTAQLVDGRLRVTCRPPRRYTWLNDGGAIDLSVVVPIGSTLDVTSGMGALACEGEFGDAELRTGMGNIRIDHCGHLRARTSMGDVLVERAVGRADVTTGSGSVRVREADGGVEVKNSNGDTAVGAVAGEVHVKASNGAIVVDRSAGPVTARSSHGGIRLGEVAGGPVSLTTATGSIEVGVADGVAAWLDVRATYGRVRSELEPTDGPGDGPAVEIRAHTAYGDITVRRAAPAGAGPGR